MEKILKEILKKLDTMDGRLNSMDDRLDSMDGRLNNIEANQERIEKKLDGVCVQTSDLTEFRTEANTKLDKLSDDIDFIKFQGYETKQDIFKLKKKISSY